MRAPVWRNRERSKFGVGPKETRTYAGVVYASKKEADYARQLDQLRTAKNPRDRVTEWRRQVSIPLYVNEILVTTYVVDFVVWFEGMNVEYHEVKGFDTPTWKLKEKLFRALHPDKVLKVIR